MNKLKKYEIPFLITLAVLVFALLFGVSYAYFRAKINNLESVSTIGFTSGEMVINYEGNTGTITGTNIIPGWSATKKFTLSGKNATESLDSTENNMKYKIILAIDNNTFTEGALTYSLAKDSSSSTNGKMADATSGTINQSGNQVIGKGYFSKTTTFVNHVYNLTISFPNTDYNQSADNGKSFAAHVTIEENNVPTPTTFAEDSWKTIAAVVQDGQLKAYPVGSEKEVEIGGKNYTVRVANNTTPKECNDLNFSQTACGFVVEFVDIVEKRNMNPSGEYKGTQYNNGWNVDGWPASAMRTYANGDFLKKLPSDLQDVIIKTNVVSGHGSTSGETNFTSTDKIYLLSGHEVWEDASPSTSSLSARDTAYNNTRQLDYYANLGVTTNNYSDAIKQYNGSNSSWWLRAPNSYYTSYFLYVYSNGTWSRNTANYNNGFAPAFRIG